MNKLITILILSLLTACASKPMKTSGSIEGKETIRVTGVGKDFNEAKRNGFRTAIEIVVGSVMVAERELVNDKITRDDIVEHSAGYVDDFKVINQVSAYNQVTVSMDVTVKNSVIATKLLNRSEPTKINGDRLSTQYQTYMNERQTGDQFLNTVLKDYPRKAYIVEQGKVDYVVNSNREAVFVIPYKVKWDYKYLTALNEALDKVKDTPSISNFNTRCMCYLTPERIVVMSKSPNSFLLGSRETYHFNDGIRADNVRNALSEKTVIKVAIIGHTGAVLHKSCVGTETTFSGTFDRGVYAVWGNAYEEEQLHITVNSSLARNMSQVNRIEMTVDTFNACHY